MSVIRNVNVGVMGHVDSGKTSLARALSTIASTAAFDKNPQSQERGITLDIGFSSFQLSVMDQEVQVTLVDCPGHASLIRTVVGGAQIIDLMILVIDVTKGFQTQTAECLVIGEIFCSRCVVVLNKVDQLDNLDKLNKLEKRVQKTLESTGFKNSVVVRTSAKSGEGLDELKRVLSEQIELPGRSIEADFLMAIDHCFQLRGQGTVLTGTVLTGKVAAGDTVELVGHNLSRKIKSIQRFREPVKSVVIGDRCGICVTEFDASQLERGLLAKPGTVPMVRSLILKPAMIRFYKAELLSGAKFHFTVGHETTLGTVTFFRSTELSKAAGDAEFSPDSEYEYCEKFEADCWCLVQLERVLPVPKRSLLLAARLDVTDAATCRLVFSGHVLSSNLKLMLPSLHIYRWKSKEGTVERKQNDSAVIVRGMTKKETKMSIFENLPVTFASGGTGIIEGGFGQSGKMKVTLRECPTFPAVGETVTLRFRKFLFQGKTQELHK